MSKAFERQQNEIRKARATMANMVNSGKVTALDRFGTPIKKGDFVIVNLSPDPMLQVMDVRPQMDPRSPPDQVIVILAVQIPIAVRAGLPVGNMVIVGSSLPEDPQDVVEVASDGEKQEVEPPAAPATGPRLVLTDTPDLQTNEEPSADRPE